MWGQDVCISVVVLLDRIIPTRVGTSLSRHSCYMIIKDHPHACGDKQMIILCRVTIVGSSPRVWGQAFHRLRQCDNHRIIPTRVGTSLT